MAIDQVDQTTESSSGFSKTIERTAEAMMMKHFQAGQYAYPRKSAIRELVSNSVDAVNEKITARKIIVDGEPVEKYYLIRDDEAFKDSKFDPGYFNINWLSGDNTVYITYEEGGNTGRDKLIIEDRAVGLGGRRLEKYFSLGFSTKKNSRFQLGKFGFGAKAAFATGVDNYLVVSRYNGQEYKFNVYLHKADSIVPSMNMTTGKMNEFVEWERGDGTMYKVYWQPTTEKNGVRVELETKKHHKEDYVQAVKSQFLYFKEIHFKIVGNGQNIIVPTEATIIYEDDGMILSDNNQFQKPHILIDKINYGFIDFKELELEELNGNIGIKINAEDVDIGTNRESVIWSDLTKASVSAAFTKVVEKAGEMVSKELSHTDFIAWLKACISISSMWSGQNNIVGRLAKVIDMKRVSPAFAPDPRFTHGHILDDLLGLKRVGMDYAVEKNKKVRRLVRVAAFMDRITELPLVVRTEGAGTRKTKYILDHMYKSGFLEIKINDDDDKLPVYALKIEKKELILKRMGIPMDKESTKRMVGGDYTTKTYDLQSEVNRDALAQYNRELYSLIQRSKDFVLFEDIIVPESYKANDDLEEEIPDDSVSVQQTKAEEESALERRKKQGRTVLFTPRSIQTLYNPVTQEYDSTLQQWVTKVKPEPPRVLELHKLEPFLDDVSKWTAEEIFFGNKEHESMMHMAAMITRVANKITELGVPRPNDMIAWRSAQPSAYGRANSYSYTTSNLSGNTAWIPNPSYKPEEALGVPDDFHQYASWFFQNKKIKLLQVSKENMRYYRDFKHIRQFFMDVQGKTLTMSNALIRWNTARLMHRELPKLRFLKGFGALSPHMTQEFMRINGFVKQYYRDMDSYTDKFFGNSSAEYNQLIGYLDKVFEFQMFVQKNPDDAEAIRELAVKWFKPKEGVELEGALAVDTAIYEVYLELLDKTEPIQAMLNAIPALTFPDSNVVIGATPVSNTKMTPELEQEVRFYCEAKSVTLYEKETQTLDDLVPAVEAGMED